MGSTEWESEFEDELLIRQTAVRLEQLGSVVSVSWSGRWGNQLYLDHHLEGRIVARRAFHCRGLSADLGPDPELSARFVEWALGLLDLVEGGIEWDKLMDQIDSDERKWYRQQSHHPGPDSPAKGQSVQPQKLQTLRLTTSA